MERSALYRRALAPIMIVSGSIGLIASVAACFVKLETNRAFSLFWMSVSLVALLGSFLLVRRQALKDAEEFWSLPTRRVTQALLPAFFVGLVVGFIFVINPSHLPPAAWVLALLWTVIYGCALHAAAFFMQRGIKLFAWAFIIGGCGLFLIFNFQTQFQSPEAAHYVMGTFFGLFHLAYGIYLYFTEKSRNAA